MNGPFSIALLNYQRVSINTNSQVASSKVSLQRGWKVGDLMGYHRDISMVISWIPSGKHHPHNLNIIPIVMDS